MLSLKSLLAASLLALAAIPAPSEAGRIGGPGGTVDRVYAGSEVEYPVAFYGGEYAMIQVDGDGDTDLDLFVYDDAGRLIAEDNDSTDFCVVRFWVPFGSNYHVVVKNCGTVYNDFTMSTN